MIFFVSLPVAFLLFRGWLVRSFVENVKRAFNAITCFGISCGNMPALARLAGEIMREPLRKGVFACNDVHVAW